MTLFEIGEYTRHADPAAWNQITAELLDLADKLDRPYVRWKKHEIARRLRDLALLIQEQWEMDSMMEAEGPPGAADTMRANQEEREP